MEHNLRGPGLSSSFSLYSPPLFVFYTVSALPLNGRTRVYANVRTDPRRTNERSPIFRLRGTLEISFPARMKRQ